jgi:hypothetical protein
MVIVGSIAPRFDSDALVDGHRRRLRWEQLHESRTLVLRFDANAAGEPALLALLADAADRLGAARAKLAVVCHPPAPPMTARSNGPEQGGAAATATAASTGPTGFPLVLDPDDSLAGLYGLVLPDGTTLWGQFIVDDAGIVRHVDAGCCRVPVDVGEIVRHVRSVFEPN